MICPICKKPAKLYDDDFEVQIKAVAFDMPYMNVYCHISCIGDLGENMESFVKENIDDFIAEKAVNIAKKR